MKNQLKDHNSLRNVAYFFSFKKKYQDRKMGGIDKKAGMNQYVIYSV